MAAPMTKRLLTVEEFQRLAAQGFFPEDQRLELIRGEIVEMSPIGDRHAFCVTLLNDLFADLRPRGMVSPQNPLRLPGQESVPQPDIVLLRRRHNFGSRPPQPEDVFLVVEVAESSLAHDRNIKIPLYAEAGIQEAWLVAFPSDSIFSYRDPSPTGYRQVREYRRGNEISPEAFPDTRFSVDEILG